MATATQQPKLLGYALLASLSVHAALLAWPGGVSVGVVDSVIPVRLVLSPEPEPGPGVAPTVGAEPLGGGAEAKSEPQPLPKTVAPASTQALAAVRMSDRKTTAMVQSSPTSGVQPVQRVLPPADPGAVLMTKAPSESIQVDRAAQAAGLASPADVGYPALSASGVAEGRYEEARRSSLVLALHRAINDLKRYPRQARRQGRQGTAEIGFDLRPDGRIEALWVVSSSGFLPLDRAALRAVSALGTFQPAVGVLSNVQPFQVSLDFRLE